jgi:hypothetical protein
LPTLVCTSNQLYVISVDRTFCREEAGANAPFLPASLAFAMIILKDVVKRVEKNDEKEKGKLLTFPFLLIEDPVSRA